MRFSLVLAALTAISLPSPASAQSLGDILGGVAQTTDNLRWGCSDRDALTQVACRVNQLNALSRQADDRRRERAWREQDAMEQSQRRAAALRRACEAGDRASCYRSGANRIPSQVYAALVDACRAGDLLSCDRIRVPAY